ncbi:MAG: phosphoenolpyruvate--protein phosphotransferase [Candidatus Krumholzibacteria bacterium]|nr:phosphoenolpyruvate--protein phosphotransferase [Candidatus Krumholzibacteria bacterium]MDH4336505.1 phosphoenolpyruvate--protein phosphotransferase [Candidatus Krumholzibacteria bacterium]MDH5269586.1 phosphoenolpyruvate--protein phosphotransferase [Candidatus Krumholzibacteria bacterium]
MSRSRAHKVNGPANGRNHAKPEFERHGISASPGIVIGTAFVRDGGRTRVPRRKVKPAAVEAEVARFGRALAETRREIRAFKTDIAKKMGDDHARIFDAHLLILDDSLLTDETGALIRSERLDAAASFEAVIDRVIDSIGGIEDEYLKERTIDVLDVKKRVIRQLLGDDAGDANRPSEPSVLVAHDLSPSDTAQFDRNTVLAYATDLGGRTSHTAIIARSQGVPAVVGLENLVDQVEPGDTVIVDGNTGSVIVNPTPSTIESYRLEIERFRELEEQLLTLTGYPAQTLDGRAFMLSANIDAPDEVESAVDHGGQGVGLFRTEYYFISQDYLPTEEEQYKVYRAVAEKMEGRPVVIRTLDIGGDKIAGYLHRSPELNPFLGWRGIRFCLTRKDIFKTQLRAIYRASAHGQVKIMFPMISQVEEIVRAKEICAEVRDDLTRERYKFADDVPLGMMVETPSAVALADHFASEVAFFSIGTNDLIQYTMAVDRGNSKIAHLYQHLHPSILRLLRITVEAARRKGVEVSVCGEMAGDPLAVPVLIGLGIDGFSVSPNVIPEVKRIIRSVTFDACRALVRRTTKFRTTAEIEAEIEAFLKLNVPSMVDNGRPRT